VEELLKDGVDVNSIDLDGRTAMHIAACEGHLEVVKLLLRWRANVNARDRWGSTVRSLTFLEFKKRGRCKVWDTMMVGSGTGII
jgi:Ankyrin repeat